MTSGFTVDAIKLFNGYPDAGPPQRRRDGGAIALRNTLVFVVRGRWRGDRELIEAQAGLQLDRMSGFTFALCILQTMKSSCRGEVAGTIIGFSETGTVFMAILFSN